MTTDDILQTNYSKRDVFVTGVEQAELACKLCLAFREKHRLFQEKINSLIDGLEGIMATESCM